jgi:hypothetical protein
MLSGLLLLFDDIKIHIIFYNYLFKFVFKIKF